MMVARCCGGDAPMMTIRMKVAGLIMATDSLCHNRISCETLGFLSRGRMITHQRLGFVTNRPDHRPDPTH